MSDEEQKITIIAAGIIAATVILAGAGLFVSLLVYSLENYYSRLVVTLLAIGGTIWELVRHKKAKKT